MLGHINIMLLQGSYTVLPENRKGVIFATTSTQVTELPQTIIRSPNVT